MHGKYTISSLVSSKAQLRKKALSVIKDNAFLVAEKDSCSDLSSIVSLFVETCGNLCSSKKNHFYCWIFA
jgi:hypothetical protein